LMFSWSSFSFGLYPVMFLMCWAVAT
jgi:hypothetical protein